MSSLRSDRGTLAVVSTMLIAWGAPAAVVAPLPPSPTVVARSQEADGTDREQASITTVEVPEASRLTNLYRIGDDLYSGSGPHDDAEFAWLASLGIRTIVSVDGTAPDVEAARRHGIRYVHLPIGYDQVDRMAILGLARVAREIRGPIYFHCHHGKHRGPAAAAAYCRLTGRLDEEGARELMRVAGTDPKYRGLWESVERLDVPPDDAELPALVETSDVDPLAAAMARLDDSFGMLKRELSTDAVDDSAAKQRAALALLVVEGLVESRRSLAADSSESLQREFEGAIGEARGLLDELTAAERSERVAPAERLERLERRCADCHANHRG